MEGIFSSKGILEYILLESNKGISTIKQMSLYSKAINKGLSPDEHYLEIWLNYISLLKNEEDPSEISKLLKMLRNMFYKFKRYLEFLLDNENDFNKTVESSLIFLETKLFDGKNEIVEYLRTADKQRGRDFCSFRNNAGALEAFEKEVEGIKELEGMNVPLGHITGTISLTTQIEGLQSKGDCVIGDECNAQYSPISIVNESNEDLSPASKSFFSYKNCNLQIIRQLGRGGSSTVFQVLFSDQIYALKSIKLNNQKTQFLTEISLLNKLKDKPGIIRLIDYSLSKNKLDLILEYGEIDLNEVIKSVDFNIFLIKDIWYQILRIIQIVHNERIIHQDLKPSNFIFVKSRIKLIDFGISKEFKDNTTKIINDNVGTVNYMSPESLTDKKLSRKTDVWSLGVILYEMVYKSTPLSSEINLITKIKNLSDGFEIIYQATDFEEMLPIIKRCLIWNMDKRADIEELLTYPY